MCYFAHVLMLYKLNQPAMNYSQTNMYTLGLAELFELMQSLLGYFQGFLVGKCTVEHNVILFFFCLSDLEAW